MDAANFESQRAQLVENVKRTAGIRDEVVLQAMRSVPREEFVSEEIREFAYQNTPLPIEEGQTISQPLIIATMIEALKLSPGDRVLEVGTGSGYAAAILSQIAQEVFTVERHRELAVAAEDRLQRLGYDNVYVLCADGTLGWPEKSPFDAIVVAAGGPAIPPALRAQLSTGGRLVIPVGKEKSSQELIRVTRKDDEEYEYEDLSGVRFVPLVGEAGWDDFPDSCH